MIIFQQQFPNKEVTSANGMSEYTSLHALLTTVKINNISIILDTWGERYDARDVV